MCVAMRRRGLPTAAGCALIAALALLAIAEADKDADAALLTIPDGFMLGAGSSSYQIEGAWDEAGKGVSTADYAYRNRTDGGGSVACDSYHKYKDDIAMLKLMGASHYRFSIAWARLLPTGEADNVNADGVRYYSALLDELEANGIEPMVTLWHVDIPVNLERAFGGWYDEKIVDYFEAYAVTVFRTFGHRVRYWTTVNEPQLFCVFGAGHGRMGATRVEPGVSEYRCLHHMLLAHARAYRAYHRQFAHLQGGGGMVGLTLNNFYTKPCTDSYDDVLAAERHQLFEVGWILEPILGSGDYPAVMRQRVGAARLPVFDEEQRQMLNGSLDYIGLNSYFGWTGCDGVPRGAGDPSFERDAAVTIPESRDQNAPPADFQWSPWSIRASLLWIRDRYDAANQIPFIITENGYGSDGAEGVHDQERIAYLSAYMGELLATMYIDKVKVLGYLVWSLLDDFEWGAGYAVKLGLVHVDFTSANRTRTPKDSLHFMKDVIATRTVPVIARPATPSTASTDLGSAATFASLLSLFILKYIIY